jgi:hypothetical protein
MAQSPASVVRGLTPTLQTMRPFRPEFNWNANQDYQLCQPFRKAWIDLFDGKDKLEESQIDFLKAYPAARLHEDNRFDIDGDGDLEIIEVFPYEIGWRHLGNNLFLFETEAEWDGFMAPFREGKATYSHYQHDDKAANPYRVLFEQAPSSTMRRFVLDGHLYTMERSTLVRLDGAEPRVVCDMNVSGYYEAMRPFLESSSAIVAARDIYGYTGICNGTMGWTAPRLGTPLPEILHRPWTLDLPDPPASDGGPAANDAWGELSFLSWGLSDPQSWRDYLEFHNSKQQFLADLRVWYVSNFNKTEAQAQQLADEAWLRMRGSLIYGYDDFLAGLAGLAVGGVAPFTADSSPAEIIRALAKDYATPDWSAVREPAAQRTLWLLRAAVYTRQPMETIRPLAEAWFREADIDLIRAAGLPDGQGVYVERYYRLIATSLLTASLGHTGLTTYFLERGVDPNARTNGFGKTPLMYAAQADQLNAVQLLISRGVDMNAKTEVVRAEQCVQLDRDHRTALMYAAENASPPVIEAMLAAGADISAKDTKGNAAVWYFGRNAKVTDSAVRARLVKALGG